MSDLKPPSQNKPGAEPECARTAMARASRPPPTSTNFSASGIASSGSADPAKVAGARFFRVALDSWGSVARHITALVRAKFCRVAAIPSGGREPLATWGLLGVWGDVRIDCRAPRAVAAA